MGSIFSEVLRFKGILPLEGAVESSDFGDLILHHFCFDLVCVGGFRSGYAAAVVFESICTSPKQTKSFQRETQVITLR